jgi:single-stranded DNA-binding protein
MDDISSFVIEGKVGKIMPKKTFEKEGRVSHLSSISVVTRPERGRDNWHRVQAWGEQFDWERELCVGDRVRILGNIQQRVWKDQQGNQHYSTDMAAETLEILVPSKDRPAAGPAPADDGDGIPF